MQLRLRIPFKLGDLQLVSFQGVERLSSPFRYELNIVSKTEIRLERLQHKPIQVSFGMKGQETRHIYGIIQSLRYLQQDVYGMSTYEGTLVPSVLRLQCHVDCRIFKQRSVVDIVKQIFTEQSYYDCEWHLSRSYPVLNYCVQYHEDSFSFIVRLLAYAGIHYYFRHAHGRDILVLLDDPAYLFFSSKRWRPHIWKKTTQHDWATSRDYRISAGSLLAYQNKNYLVWQVSHRAYCDWQKQRYLNQVELQQALISTLPATPTCAQPLAHGVELATVIGPPYEQVHTDALARIQCRFDWDQRDAGQKSCWLPTTQWVAGASGGSVYLPAVSQTVCIVYQHANPDEPMMIGGFYTAAVASNELSFGALRAAKDLQMEIKDSFLMQIGGNVMCRLQQGYCTHTVAIGQAQLSAVELRFSSGNHALQLGAQGVQFQGPNVLFVTSDAANASELRQQGVQNVCVGA